MSQRFLDCTRDPGLRFFSRISLRTIASHKASCGARCRSDAILLKHQISILFGQNAKSKFQFIAQLIVEWLIPFCLRAKMPVIIGIAIGKVGTRNRLCHRTQSIGELQQTSLVTEDVDLRNCVTDVSGGIDQKGKLDNDFWFHRGSSFKLKFLAASMRAFLLRNAACATKGFCRHPSRELGSTTRLTQVISN